LGLRVAPVRTAGPAVFGTGGTVWGSSIEPLSATRNIAMPPLLCSRRRWKKPGQSADISPWIDATSEWPISWLWAAMLMTVTIGLPSGVLADSTPILGSRATPWPLSSVVGKFFDRCTFTVDGTGIWSADTTAGLRAS
jgi:hypothetical protein